MTGDIFSQRKNNIGIERDSLKVVNIGRVHHQLFFLFNDPMTLIGEKIQDDVWKYLFESYGRNLKDISLTKKR